VRVGQKVGAVAMISAVLVRAVMAATSPEHLGVATCASSLCHGSVQPLNVSHVQQNEYVVWSQFDPHSRAYRSLLEERGRAIGRRLGLSAPHTAPQCLSCHSDDVPAAARGERFQVADGVGCEACHGAAETWLATHHQTDVEAPAKHVDNVSRGLADLPSTAVRAKVCMSCHVGDNDRLATHRMMAAGHPRLSFELDTYTELWRTAGGREHYLPGAASAAVAQPIATWLQGLTAVTDRSFALLLARTRKQSVSLPEFALFNCYSCHRSMRVAGWGSAEAEADLPPGTLRLPDGAPRLLVAVGVELSLTAVPQFQRDFAALQRAYAEGTADVAAPIETTRADLRRIESALRVRKWTRQDTERALQGISKAAKKGCDGNGAATGGARFGSAREAGHRRPVWSVGAGQSLRLRALRRGAATFQYSLARYH
jgi:Cytochrome c554 and c-prime